MTLPGPLFGVDLQGISKPNAGGTAGQPGLNKGRDSLELLTQFQEVRTLTARLASLLSPEDACIQSMPDASPAKWHLAHTTWFFEQFVLAKLPHYEMHHPQYGYLFNSYYNAVGQRHPRPYRGLLSRPSLDDVLEYRLHVETALAQPLGSDEIPGELAPIIEIGLHHEQQHQELLLTDIKHALSCNPLRPAFDERPLPAGNADCGSLPLQWIDVPAGLYSIGHDGQGFAYDNEGPRHRVFLEAYQLASRPITAGEFAEFIDAGGYRQCELWLSAGWDWVQQHGRGAPLYWEQDADGRWTHFTLHGQLPIDPHEPVCHVNFYEADAYARWADARLPTEAEWEVAAAGAAIVGNFAESQRWHVAPAYHHIARHPEKTAPRFCQLYGDVWEWTGSAYRPYPGYRPPAGALGEYNGKFMSNQFVLRGGSCASPQSHLRCTYRNFFPPEAAWQFMGFRLARDT